MEGVRIGCAGWSIPRQSAAKFGASGNHLERYGQVLNCSEINSSFYRPHKAETWERWARSVPADFRFSVKFPRAVTHEAKLDCSAALLRPFLQQAGLLGDKLGPLLLQLPPSLGFSRDRATSFLTLLREEFRGDVACEPRHGSWFHDSANELLKEFRVARVAADPACVPAASEPGGLESLAYFRLHGSPRRYYSAYSSELLETLATKLARLAQNGQVWCIFDNTASGAAIENALELTRTVRPLLRT
jgi:uncharacterized protein YecE (DUF72 family)